MRSSRRSASTSRSATTPSAQPRSSTPAQLRAAANRPAHYIKRGVELTDVIEAYGLGWHASNVVKYLLRYQHKGDALRDLMKAEWYLRRLIAVLERAERRG